MSSLRQNVKESILAAIQSNTKPRIPNDNIGLVLPVSSGRSRQLVHNDGRSLTAAGRFYYDQIGQEFNPFDVNQPETLKRRTKYMTFLDGSERAVARFSNIDLEWKLTRLGQKVYDQKKNVLCYIVAYF